METFREVGKKIGESKIRRVRLYRKAYPSEANKTDGEILQILQDIREDRRSINNYFKGISK